MKSSQLIRGMMLLTLGLGSNQSLADLQLNPEMEVRKIEAMHAGEAFAAKTAVQADFSLDFGEMFQVKGTMLFTPSMGKVRLNFDGGAVVVFDGSAAWVSPADAVLPGPPARFHVLTWPYFMAASYKLDDPGTLHTAMGMLPVRPDQKLQGVKITFGDGVGDAPDDWYIAFAHPETGRLTALAYIVTYGKSKEEAEKQPSIILYDDFIDVDGIPFATTWTFAYWNAADGIVGDPKGTGRLSNIRFVTPAPNTFVKPDGATESKAPGQ